MNNILVVCQGNVCRSPMAMGLLAEALPNVRLHSAGLDALVGMPPDETAVRLMRERGIDISHHRAVQINRELCLDAELVLVMSAEQRKEVEKRYPTSHGRVFRIGEFGRKDVPDPYRQSQSAFERALTIIDEGVREWLQRIQQI
jgi:protein-tyrosine phosphatase